MRATRADTQSERPPKAGTGDAAVGRWDSTLARLRPHHRFATVVLLVLVVAAQAFWIDHTMKKSYPMDFFAYYVAAEFFAEGRSPYDAWWTPEWKQASSELDRRIDAPYLYPAQTAAIVNLLRPLGPQGALLAWEIANSLAMVLGALVLGRALGGRWMVPLSLAALLFWWPAFTTLTLGQVNGLVFLCLASAIWGITHRNDWALGLGLGAGVVLKMFPFALVAYLVWRRRWRPTLIALGTIVATTLATMVVFDPATVADFFWDGLRLTQRGVPMRGPANHTIPAMVGYLPGIGTHTAAVTGYLLSLALIVATAVLCWPRGDWRRWAPLEFSLVVCASLLAPSFSWYHLLVVSLVPALVVAQTLWRQKCWTWLALGALLFAATTVHGPVVYHYYTEVARLGVMNWLIAPFLFQMFLWCTAAWLLWRGKWAAE